MVVDACQGKKKGRKKGEDTFVCFRHVHTTFKFQKPQHSPEGMGPGACQDAIVALGALGVIPNIFTDRSEHSRTEWHKGSFPPSPSL